MRTAFRQALIINIKLFSGIFKKHLAKETPTLACLSVDLNTHTPDEQQPVDRQHLTAHGTSPTKSDKSPDPTIATLGDLPSEADPSNAITTAETTLGTATADAGSPPTGTGQSNATSPVETTAPPANADGGRPLSEADPSQVRRGETQSVSPLKQATQLSDKAGTDGQLAGGQNSPRPPKEPKKKKDNKVSFRADDDLQERISSYAESAGLTESEAARVLIEAALGQPRVIIKPKAPPIHLEFFAKQIKAWIKMLRGVRSRLIAPMPEPDDAVLTELVKTWRAMSAQLLEELPALLESARAQRRLLTTLDAENIADLRVLYGHLKGRIPIMSKKVGTFSHASSPEAKSNDTALRNSQMIAKLIEDLGIIEGDE